MAAVAILACLAPGSPARELLTAADLVDLQPTTIAERIIYADESPHQFGHLLLPQKSHGHDSTGPFPVALLVHGGCWLSQYDIKHLAALENALAEDGFAVWSIEYRRVGDDGGGWPNTFLDVARGADHLRKLAEDHPLDLDRVIVVGHSAGGQMALWLAARDRIAEDSDLHLPEPLKLQGVLALAPAPDLAALHARGTCGNVIDKLMGGSPEQFPERYDAASPVELPATGLPQILIGGNLDAGFGDGAFRYHAVASDPTEVVLREIPGAGHFEVIAPRTPAGREVREELKKLLGRLP